MWCPCSGPGLARGGWCERQPKKGQGINKKRNLKIPTKTISPSQLADYAIDPVNANLFLKKKTRRAGVAGGLQRDGRSILSRCPRLCGAAILNGAASCGQSLATFPRRVLPASGPACAASEWQRYRCPHSIRPASRYRLPGFCRSRAL